jgi:hypothetical protein
LGNILDKRFRNTDAETHIGILEECKSKEQCEKEGMHVIKYTEKLEISVKKYEREMEMHLEVYE